MRRAAIVGSLAVLLTAATARAEPAMHEEIAACRNYRVALEAARRALVNGERAQAISELTRAKDAMAACRREEAQTASLLAAADAARRRTT